jgi:hypothetical protein
LIENVEELYIPQSDRELQRVQRKSEELDRLVRGWAHSVIAILPRGLPMNADETYLLSLFLAHQRRRNLELDGFDTESGLIKTALQAIPFLRQQPEPELLKAAHRNVAARLESDIERACTFFCEDNNVSPDSEPAIDWRVSVRFMAQSIYARACTMDHANVHEDPRRFELALVTRDLACEVTERRHQMLATLAAS